MKTVSPSVWVCFFVLELSNVNGLQLYLIFLVGICRVNLLIIIFTNAVSSGLDKRGMLKMVGYYLGEYESQVVYY